MTVLDEDDEELEEEEPDPRVSQVRPSFLKAPWGHGVVDLRDYIVACTQGTDPLYIVLCDDPLIFKRYDGGVWVLL